MKKQMLIFALGSLMLSHFAFAHNLQLEQSLPSVKVAKAWHLNAKDSAIIVLDKRGKVKFVKEGKLSQTDIQAVISLITELTK